MLTALASFIDLLQRVPATGADLPRRLFESAEARAGQDPRHAQELRRAACAALRVVR